MPVLFLELGIFLAMASKVRCAWCFMVELVLDPSGGDSLRIGGEQWWHTGMINNGDKHGHYMCHYISHYTCH